MSIGVENSIAALWTKDANGNPVQPNSYPRSYVYNSDGTVASESYTDGSNTWTRTFTYSSGLLTGVSQWVKS